VKQECKRVLNGILRHLRNLQYKSKSVNLKIAWFHRCRFRNIPVDSVDSSFQADPSPTATSCQSAISVAANGATGVAVRLQLSSNLTKNTIAPNWKRCDSAEPSKVMHVGVNSSVFSRTWKVRKVSSDLVDGDCEF